MLSSGVQGLQSAGSWAAEVQRLRRHTCKNPHRASWHPPSARCCRGQHGPCQAWLCCRRPWPQAPRRRCCHPPRSARSGAPLAPCCCLLRALEHGWLRAAGLPPSHHRLQATQQHHMLQHVLLIEGVYRKHQHGKVKLKIQRSSDGRGRARRPTDRPDVSFPWHEGSED